MGIMKKILFFLTITLSSCHVQWVMNHKDLVKDLVCTRDTVKINNTIRVVDSIQSKAPDSMYLKLQIDCKNGIDAVITQLEDFKTKGVFSELRYENGILYIKVRTDSIEVVKYKIRTEIKTVTNIVEIDKQKTLNDLYNIQIKYAKSQEKISLFWKIIILLSIPYIVIVVVKLIKRFV